MRKESNTTDMSAGLLIVPVSFIVITFFVIGNKTLNSVATEFLCAGHVIRNCPLMLTMVIFM